MNLFFLRHGKACARSRKWHPDSTRPLTRDGERKMFEAARGIRHLDLSFDLILTSPYLRAFRTAEIVAEVLGSKVIESKNLVAEAPGKAIVDEINQGYAGCGQIVLVGHEPFLSGLISVLLSGKETAAIELRKGGLCNLSMEKLNYGRCATLEWLMTPNQLAKLG